jgi:uncharacterized protein involved in exopolysaccharide biosynthesis
MFEALLSRLHDEVRRIWLYRWFLAAVTLVAFLAIAGFLVSMPKRYDSWSEIYVDKQAAMSAATQNVALNGAATPSSVMINPKVLLNDDKLQATLVKLDPSKASLSPMQMTNAVKNFRKTIAISDLDEDGFIQFHVKDVDPVRATRVVQELTRQFIDMSINRSQNDLGQTTKFLDGQIESFKGLMAASQEQLANFRHAHPGLPLQGGLAGGLAAPAASGTVVTLASPTSEAAAPAAPPAPRVFPEDQKIAALEAQLADMQTRYTDQHPDVISTKRDLAVLLRQRAAEAAIPVAAAPTAPTPAPDNARRAAQVVRGPGRAAVIPPDIAAAWGTLIGNDEMLRADYQQLINKQQAAKMSSAILGSSKRFEIIRPPIVPLVSYMPPRSWLVGGAAIAALAIGLVATFLRAAISGVLVSPRELEEEFDLPVAGTVSWEPAWQTGKVAKVDPRFIPPFMRPRIGSTHQRHRLVESDASL